MPRGMGKARQGKGRALPLPADWHGRSVTSTMAVPRRTPFRPVPGVYRFKDDVTYITERCPKSSKPLLSKRYASSPVDALLYAHRYARDIAGRQPFAARHPVYCAAHRCIFPMYRFGADVTALAKPLKACRSGNLSPLNGGVSLITRASFSRYARGRLSARRSLSLSFFPSRRCHPVAPPGMPRENPRRRALMARSKPTRAKLREAIDGGAARRGFRDRVLSAVVKVTRKYSCAH